jgi:hypothetical protein
LGEFHCEAFSSLSPRCPRTPDADATFALKPSLGEIGKVQHAHPERDGEGGARRARSTITVHGETLEERETEYWGNAMVAGVHT